MRISSKNPEQRNACLAKFEELSKPEREARTLFLSSLNICESSSCFTKAWLSTLYYRYVCKARFSPMCSSLKSIVSTSSPPLPRHAPTSDPTNCKQIRFVSSDFDSWIIAESDRKTLMEFPSEVESEIYGSDLS